MALNRSSNRLSPSRRGQMGIIHLLYLSLSENIANGGIGVVLLDVILYLRLVILHCLLDRCGVHIRNVAFRFIDGSRRLDLIYERLRVKGNCCAYVYARRRHIMFEADIKRHPERKTPSSPHQGFDANVVSHWQQRSRVNMLELNRRYLSSCNYRSHRDTPRRSKRYSRLRIGEASHVFHESVDIEFSC